jgi:hypothetical protein
MGRGSVELVEEVGLSDTGKSKMNHKAEVILEK